MYGSRLMGHVAVDHGTLWKFTILTLMRRLVIEYGLGLKNVVMLN